MILKEFGELFKKSADGSQPVLTEGTLLYPFCMQIIEMALSYSSDGMAFLKGGDPVNAHASFTYGAGWLDAGIALGYVLGARVIDEMPLFSFTLPDEKRDFLREKTEKYGSMLTRACCSVTPAPEKETQSAGVSENLLTKAEFHLEEGGVFLNRGDHVEALAHFSYGYGWLDVGVRGGFFQILACRDLFPV